MTEKMPLDLVVLASDVLEQYGERFAFDFATLSAADRTPLDYDHDEREIIGYCENFVFTPEKVTARGVLLSGDDSPNARANEIAFALSNGVPYQASAFIDCADSDAQTIKGGETATVNGREIQGPATIYSRAVIRGVAVCPYGCDPAAAAAPVALSSGKGGYYQLKGTLSMSQIGEEEKKELQEATDFVDVQEDAQDAPETKAREVDPLLLEFVALFGAEKGLRLYLDGVEIEEARAQAQKEEEERKQGEEIAALRKSVDDLRALVLKLSRRGDSLGVSATPAGKRTPPDPIAAAAEKFRRQGTTRAAR